MARRRSARSFPYCRENAKPQIIRGGCFISRISYPADYFMRKSALILRMMPPPHNPRARDAQRASCGARSRAASCGRMQASGPQASGARAAAGCERANRGLWRDANRRLRQANRLQTVEDARQVMAGCKQADREGCGRDAGRKLRRTNQLLAAEDARRVVGPQQAAGGDGLRTVNGCGSRAAARCEQTNREWRRVVGPRSVGDDRLRTGYEARRAANHSERAAREGTPAVRRFSAYNELRVSASRKRTGRKPPLRAAKKRASPPLRACPRRLAVRHSKCFT